MKSKATLKIKRGSHSIYARILLPVCFLVIVESLLLVGSVFGGGLTARLNQNSQDILGERVLNRKSYLENEMINNWSRVAVTVKAVNEMTEKMIRQGEISMETLDDDFSGSTKLLSAVSGDIIAMMRSCKTTGGFIILSGGDLTTEEEKGVLSDKPGLYLRDMDPISSSSAENTDLLLERAPTAVAQALNIATDSGWKPQFEFSEGRESYYDFLDVPCREAVEKADEDLSYLDFGYWSGPFVLGEDNREAMAYSVPLILSDGTVYGVLGIDITLDYLRKVIPYGEVADDKRGSYILAIGQGEDPVFKNVLINGPVFKQAEGGAGEMDLQLTEDGFVYNGKDQDFYCVVEYLNLYNSNAPFSDQRWALIGAVREQDLYSFTTKVTRNMLAAVFFTLLVSVAGSLLVSRLISRPVEDLMKDISEMNRKRKISLHRTGIQEIDSLEASIEELSRDVIDSATKFTQIIELASVKLGGFEVRRDNHQLFITDGFFDIFKLNGVDTKGLSPEGFETILWSLRRYLKKDVHIENEAVFRIPSEEGFVFVKLKYVDNETRCIGLVEDVTQAMRERDLIEHERDHDSLTGLLNRRAFSRRIKALFEEEQDVLKTAALVMLDLDNLKTLNDTYGHDCGDKYIQSAADCFLSAVPAETIVSRISGDEFYLFFYGYEDKDKIRALLNRLSEAICGKSFLLPGKKEQKIMASGGVTWYPDDSENYEELLRFSDFAMYKVKQSRKGELKEFDIGIYNREAYLSQSKAELTELIEKSLAHYYFQPIINARTGELYAYEALLRANMPTLHSAMEIIELAREESKLDQIEKLTWFSAMGAYTALVEAGKIDRDCRVFVNSIASQSLCETDLLTFEERFQGYLDRIVLELTEEERLNEDGLHLKKKWLKKWKAELALDDYGSGYNSERMLLDLSPNYIKIDIAIIRNIHNDPDKQEIVKNIVAYGHERNMAVIAEGVETREEAAKVVAMGVDYLQGYWIAKPLPDPPLISSNIRKEILAINGIKD